MEPSEGSSRNAVTHLLSLSGAQRRDPHFPVTFAGRPRIGSGQSHLRFGISAGQVYTRLLLKPLRPGSVRNPGWVCGPLSYVGASPDDLTIQRRLR